MKKSIFFAVLYCLQPALHAAAPINATARALAHFKEKYAWVEDASWYSTTEKNIYCVFQQGNMVNRVYYDSRGYWQYTMISYPPSCLAKDVKEIVLNSFGSYKIYYVNEIRSLNYEPVYMISIENENNIKVIRVCGEDIEVTQDLKKR